MKRNIKLDMRSLAMLPSSTPMDIKYYGLAIRAIDILVASPNYRVVIAIGGTPGSGKSTLASKVTSILNKYRQSALDNSYRHYHRSRSPIGYTSNNATIIHTPDSSNFYSKSINNTATSTPTISALSNPGISPAGDLDDLDISLGIEDLNLGPAIHDSDQKKDCVSSRNKHHAVSNSDFATTVTMDGYHLTRAELDQFDDPVEAHKRRGSPWTFDAQGVVNMAKSLYNSCIPKSKFFEDSRSSGPKTLRFPSFDHAIKDPTPDGIEVLPQARVVFLEGLYTLYNENPWNQIASYADDSWMIFVDLDISTLRLAKRHLEAGIVDTLAAGIERVKINDELNARLILENHIEPKVMINSISC